MTSKSHNLIRAILYLWVSASIALLPGCSKTISDSAISSLAIADAARMLESDRSRTVFVDTRSASEFRERRIAGAIRVDLRTFDPQSPPAAIRSAREIIVYGQDPSTASSIALTKRLMQAGYNRVYHMRDGLSGWIARSLPTESG